MAEDLCFVCGRPMRSADKLYIGRDQSRHRETCAPGTEAWAVRFPHTYSAKYFRQQEALRLAEASERPEKPVRTEGPIFVAVKQRRGLIKVFLDKATQKGRCYPLPGQERGGFASLAEARDFAVYWRSKEELKQVLEDAKGVTWGQWFPEDAKTPV